MTDVGLFEEPPPQPLTLSVHFSTYEYRVVADSKVSYRKRSMTKFHPCEECSYLQHETRGVFGPKRAVRQRRTGPGECERCTDEKKHQAHIDLCHEHAQLWRERDEHDSKRR